MVTKCEPDPFFCIRCRRRPRSASVSLCCPSFVANSECPPGEGSIRRLGGDSSGDVHGDAVMPVVTDPVWPGWSRLWWPPGLAWDRALAPAGGAGAAGKDTARPRVVAEHGCGRT